ncbi:A/G-specific adenine glycosylase [Patescibacteria group bacterium]|nr:A/G-specific adenine glycosylase [Patescibacteria group bacterium]
MNLKQKAFVTTIKKFYTTNGRHDLPWRHTHDPYRILVSEIMLQQTQVARVITKYDEFLNRFPTVQSLATAPLGAVLTLWQGLGYNRRAKMLHECAKTIVNEYNGVWPRDIATLRSLPGIGPYTAGAVAAFAFNVSSTIIETNIRTVYLHHFFPQGTDVPDAALLPIITATLDNTDPRSWYYALMDYGSHLKQTIGNKNTQSKHYSKQSKFFGSDRQIRGAIIRALSSKNTSITFSNILKEISSADQERLRVQLTKLISEKMVEKVGARYQLPQ